MQTLLNPSSHSKSTPSVPGQRRLAELKWVDSGAPVCWVRWLDAPGYLLALRHTRHEGILVCSVFWFGHVKSER